MMLPGCKESKKLDLNKIDSTYFIGAYSCNLGGQTERFILKADGTYDYYWDADTVEIENAGKWTFEKGKYPSVSLWDFPNYRQVIYPEEEKNDSFHLHFDIDANNAIGNLTFMVIYNEDEREYIFEPEIRKQ